jgi:hypothetical protein
MDLAQNKLTRQEWETIEVPVTDAEKATLRLIIAGYHDVNTQTNETTALFSFIKIENTTEMEYFLYRKYFEAPIDEMLKKYGKDVYIDHPMSILSKKGGGQLKTIKSADMIRLQNLDANIKVNRERVFEFLLLDLAKDLLKAYSKKKSNYAYYLYTLLQLKKTSIRHQNQYVINVLDRIIAHILPATNLETILSNAYAFIERNPYLLQYEDRTLFPHQKELFTICKSRGAKLILYTAPTGTGKTVSPIGLSEKYRVIFVCVARHIGLALAKAAISVEKKVAFAFGCETASDIRLHYFSAVNYTVNKRSGGIGKVDNSVGDAVEIMICDVQSYLTAMHYMLAFNDATNIITYWDEPTITLDYEQHPLHQTIHRNWAENKIPKVVLSCATLPATEDLQSVFDDFRAKFDDVEIHTITSFDCRKSIPMLGANGCCVMPHYMYASHADLRKCAEYCVKNKTLLRYFDLREMIQFIEYVHKQKAIPDAYSVHSYFDGNIANITMNRLKEYYLEVLLHVDPEAWPGIHTYMIRIRVPKYSGPGIQKSTSIDMATTQPHDIRQGQPLARTSSVAAIPQPKTTGSGVLLTTSDAHTLTDGPTIFLADDIQKIGTFYLQQSRIPDTISGHILSKILKNDEVMKQITKLEREIKAKEEKQAGGSGEEKSSQKNHRVSKEVQEWMDQIDKLRKEILMVSLDPCYVPNQAPHQKLWAPGGEFRANAFSASIGEETTRTIMMLDIDSSLKMLLLLGIGMFLETADTQYIEIMKRLANEQRLFMIIAATDYIYGTNYSFCHGFIGKDLTNMTQQKTLQAMGRIGRNNIQQDYTVRFRDDAMIAALFEKPARNLEAENMSRLFSSDV